MSRRLPELIDVRTACLETTLPKPTIETIFRAIAKDGGLVRPPGVRRVFVHRDELQRRLGGVA